MTNAEKKIMEYINQLSTTDNAIKQALNNENKSSHKMMRYICEEAKKEAGKGENSCCIDDDTVYKWARHYWLEVIDTDTKKDEEVEDVAEVRGDEETLSKNAKKSRKQKQSDTEQLSLFDFGDNE